MWIIAMLWCVSVGCCLPLCTCELFSLVSERYSSGDFFGFFSDYIAWELIWLAINLAWAQKRFFIFLHSSINIVGTILELLKPLFCRYFFYTCKVKSGCFFTFYLIFSDSLSLSLAYSSGRSIKNWNVQQACTFLLWRYVPSYSYSLCVYRQYVPFLPSFK